MKLGKRILLVAIILSLVFSNTNVFAVTDTLTMPAALKIIHEEAFYGDTSISKVVLPEGLTEIQARAFAGSSLSEINLPASITFIDQSAFDGPDKVTVTVNEGSYAYDWAVTNNYIVTTDNPNISSLENGLEYTNDGIECVITGYAGSDSEVIIPEYIEGVQVTRIANHAFEFCNALTKMTIPDGVISIGEDAFWFSGLTEITMPTSVTEIGEGAFGGTKISSIPPLNSIAVVPDYMFWGCSNLTNVTLPGNIIGIGEGAFCLTNIASINLPDGIKTIRKSAFNSSRLRKVEIPKSIEYIGDSAFAGCGNLEKVTIKGMSIIIGQNSFANCAKLEIYGYSNSSIEEYANNNSLQFCSMNAATEHNPWTPYNVSIKRIDENTAQICWDCDVNTSRFNVWVSNKSDNDEIYENNNNMRSYMTIEKDDSNGLICHSVCRADPNENNGILLSSDYDDYMSEGDQYRMLVKFLVPGRNYYIRVDSNISYNGSRCASEPILLNAVPYNQVDDYDDFEFEIVNYNQCYLIKYNGNKSTVSIPDRAIEGRQIWAIDRSAFKDAENIQNVKVPEGVEIIHTKAFNNLPNLKNVDLPSSLLRIDWGAFYKCTSLSNILIPTSVESLSEEAFLECGEIDITHDSGSQGVILPLNDEQRREMEYIDTCYDLVLGEHSMFTTGKKLKNGMTIEPINLDGFTGSVALRIYGGLLNDVPTSINDPIAKYCYVAETIMASVSTVSWNTTISVDEFKSFLSDGCGFTIDAVDAITNAQIMDAGLGILDVQTLSKADAEYLNDVLKNSGFQLGGSWYSNTKDSVTMISAAMDAVVKIPVYSNYDKNKLYRIIRFLENSSSNDLKNVATILRALRTKEGLCSYLSLSYGYTTMEKTARSMIIDNLEGIAAANIPYAWAIVAGLKIGKTISEPVVSFLFNSNTIQKRLYELQWAVDMAEEARLTFEEEYYVFTNNPISELETFKESAYSFESLVINEYEALKDVQKAIDDSRVGAMQNAYIRIIDWLQNNTMGTSIEHATNMEKIESFIVLLNWRQLSSALDAFEV